MIFPRALASSPHLVESDVARNTGADASPNQVWGRTALFPAPGLPSGLDEVMTMQTIRLTLGGVLLFSLACSWLAAQDPPPRLEVFAQGGASILNNGSGQVLLSGCPVCTQGLPCPMEVLCAPPTLTRVTSSFSKAGRFFVGGRLRFTRHEALEASYSFSPNRSSFWQGNQSFGSGYDRVDLVAFNYVHYLWVRTPVQPFATIGLGTNHFSGGPSVVPSIVSPSIKSDNGHQFAWNYGGGADIVLQRHFALRLELRDYVTSQPSFITGTSHNLVPSAGIVLRFR